MGPSRPSDIAGDGPSSEGSDNIISGCGPNRCGGGTQQHLHERGRAREMDAVYCGFVNLIASMCVCVFSSHSFWTSMDVPAGVTQEEGNTGFSIHLLSAVLALIFLAR
ncbi:unnamed protein product, partial [Ascophyllum nodosum]